MSRHVRALAVAPDDLELGDGRTISVRVVSWGTDYRVTDDGQHYYDEQYAPGGLNMRPGAELVATSEHDARLLPPGVTPRSQHYGAQGVSVGRIAATHVRTDGLYADVRLFDSIDGDGFLAYVRSLGDRRPLYVSPEFDDEVHDTSSGRIVRTNAELTGLAFTLTPQYGDARVLAVRSQPNPTPGGQPTMKRRRNPDGTYVVIDDAGNELGAIDDEPGQEPAGEPASEPAPEPAAQEPAMAGARSQPRRQAPRPGAAAGPARSSHFRSMGHYAQAVALGQLGGPDDERRQRFARALATATTADAAGLLPEQWMTEVIDLYRTLTPAVQAFRQRTLPDTGLVVNQPVVTQRPIVNQVSTELTDLGTGSASQKAIIGNASWDVETYGGGLNVSLQAIMRTEPGYLDELYRLWVREMALDINGDVCANLVLAADSGEDGVNDPLEYTTAAAFDELVVDASAVFLDTMHRPAEVVLLSVDLWKALAKAKDSDGHHLYPSVNPMNRSGRMDAVDTEGNIIGVTWYVEPGLGGVGDGVQAIIGVRDAYMTATSPMGTLAADVPTSLSRDQAVYQFAAFGATDATGLVLVEDAS